MLENWTLLEWMGVVVGIAMAITFPILLHLIHKDK
jgi:hypothetical protein